MRKICGVLRAHSTNPRYFTDDTGKPIYLTGSHTWSNIQEYLGPDPDKKFDYPSYLDWLEGYGFNFMRGWVWEEASYDNVATEKIYIGPLPYVRSGPGIAADGEAKFDLDTFNQDYFDRLRERVVQAGERGIYVSVMLFNRWSTNERPDAGKLAWNGHPFNKDNNINNIDGDPEGLGGRMIHTLALPEVLKYQEHYVKKVIDTVGDLENVLYEIGNEHWEDSGPWQCYMVRFIKDYEAGRLLQHPVGITSGGGAWRSLANQKVLDSPADWISLRPEEGMAYDTDPVAADGIKVNITDTDHIWGLGGNVDWVWKSMTRGLNPILMDPYEPIYGMSDYTVESWKAVNCRDHPTWEPIRRNLAYAKTYAQRMELEAAVPRTDLATSGYCLAQYGQEYLVYIPEGREIAVNLGDERGEFAVEWLNPDNGETVCGDKIQTANEKTFINPFSNAAVLYIARAV
ncbi:MAG: hypothetical protein BWY15_01947 [Firmicutes bacterium ADurb.Bin193]|nr:MAG: hypothetical protein BWY15_01947 [Firmicutes bacterium ADurb.Bin193]